MMEIVKSIRNYTLLDLLLGIFLTTFVFGITLGADFFHLMDNALCFKHLGCNATFGGFDALRHFFSGLTQTVFLYWLYEKYPHFFPRTKSRWTKMLLVIFIIIATTIFWETGEYIHDHYRTNILHENLSHPNVLDQPSTSDTIGDSFYNIISSLFTSLVLTLKL